MRTSYLTTEMCQEVHAERISMSAEKHLTAATSLLAGDFDRDSPYRSTTYHWVPPTSEQAARAQAHATVAMALMAAERNAQVTIAAPEIRPAVPR